MPLGFVQGDGVAEVRDENGATLFDDGSSAGEYRPTWNREAVLALVDWINAMWREHRVAPRGFTT